MTKVLGVRALNRATLQRQLLLQRARMPALAAVEHLVGLQAQVPAVPYTALWNRLTDFDPEELAGLMRRRAVVRMALMRSTLHLVSARDALGLRARMAPVLARTFAGTTWSKRLPDDAVDDVLAHARVLLEERPRTRAEIGRLLHERWPEVDGETLGMAATYLLPLVQPTPRGLWGQSGQARWELVGSWLGTEPGSGTPIEDVILRFLEAYGPASVRDVQTWCGLTRLGEVADRLGNALRRYRTESGVVLLDVPDAVLPDPDTPAPPRFLPEYDNGLLAYADRSRVVAEADHVPMLGGPGGHVGTLLADGFVSATWAVRRTGSRAVVDIRPSMPIPVAHDADIQAEAARLLQFLAPGADHDVRTLG